MAESESVSLLVVDDEPDMLRGLTRLLKLRGFDVVTAGSGEEAIERIREHEPDGVLMDIRMPGIDGVEAFRQIRAIAPNAFVILMTAFTTLMDEAREEGPVDVLSKPLDWEEICKLIEDAAVTRPVLVVDDEPDFLRSLSRTLTTHGLEVHQAANIEQAIAIFEKRPRALVLLDMKLNGTNGLDVLQEIKRRNPQAVVVQMSGHAEMHDEMQQGLTMNASQCFTKPFDIDELVNALRHVMREPKKTA